MEQELEALQESTTVILLQDSDPLCVETTLLTKCSRVFRFILDECQFEEHDLSDFSPDAVRVFLTLLDDGKMGEIEENMLREINKMAVAFEIAWLQEECREWFRKKILAAQNEEEKTFLFEESYFILIKLKDQYYMKMFVDQFGGSDDVNFILSKYLSDLENLDIEMIYPLLQLGGDNSEIFYKTICDSIRNSSHLGKNVLYLLQNINIRYFQANLQQWSNLFEEIVELPDISVSSLRSIYTLSNEAWRAVSSDSSKEESTKTIYDGNKNMGLLYMCDDIDDIVRAVNDGKIDSMGTVIILLMRVLQTSSSSHDEIDQFISNIERLCEKKKLNRVPRQIIDSIISTLEHSDKENAKHLVSLLTRLQRNTVFSSPIRETNILHGVTFGMGGGMGPLQTQAWVYTLKHSTYQNCTQPGKCGFILREGLTGENITFIHLVTDRSSYLNSGVHYHDNISARDLCVYWVWTVILPNGVVLDTIELELPRCRLSKFWLPPGTKREFKAAYVAYNVSDYMVAK